MGAISQTVFSNPFSLMTFVIFWFRFHWNLLLRAQLTITQHWFGWMPEAEQAQAVIWINDNLVYSSSICQNHLKWISSGKHSIYFVNHIIASLREICLTWWRHKMETFSALLAICAGNSPVSGEFPAQRPVTRSFDVFFDLRLNKRLSKQSWGWWFETLSCPLWRHRNVRIKMSAMKSTVGEFMSYDFIQKLKRNNVYISFILLLCWTQWPLGGTVVILHQES